MEFAPAVADSFTPTMSLTGGKVGIGTTTPTLGRLTVKDSTDSSSSNYTLTVKTASGTGYTMPVAATALVYSNGTNTA